MGGGTAASAFARAMLLSSTLTDLAGQRAGDANECTGEIQGRVIHSANSNIEQALASSNLVSARSALHSGSLWKAAHQNSASASSRRPEAVTGSPAPPSRAATTCRIPHACRTRSPHVTTKSQIRRFSSDP